MIIIKAARRRSFLTLFEVMIAITIITLIGGALFSSFRPLLEKRKFSSDLLRLSERCILLRSLAMYQEKDIEVELILEKEKASLSSYEEIRGLNLIPFTIDSNNQKVDSIRLNFLSTGEVEPKESVKISFGKESRFFSFQQ